MANKRGASEQSDSDEVTPRTEVLDYGYLAQLLGPKSENRDFFFELVRNVVSDYLYWRTNYFPEDPQIRQSLERHELDAERNRLRHRATVLMSKLKKSFPLHNPRYAGHMHSETTLASVIGSFAGTLFNANNVTTESGMATVDLEIDVCNDLLRMIGFIPMPDTPTGDSPAAWEDYQKKLKQDFGWCHLTSGGTVANIEALWVARAVKFFPLAVKDVCISEEIELYVKLPRDTLADDKPGGEFKLEEMDIRFVEDPELLGLRPIRALYLFGRLVEALQGSKKQKEGPRFKPLTQEQVWERIDKSDYSPSKGVFGLIDRGRTNCPTEKQVKSVNDGGPKTWKPYKPKIFVSGAAHYSIEKAANILGLGKDAVVHVPPGKSFRVTKANLKKAMKRELKENKACTPVILAVVAVVGTTEEGAVDPLHEFVELRNEWEQERNQSFWLHVDAAWGGFMRTLFISDDRSQGADGAGQHVEKKAKSVRLDERQLRERLRKLNHEVMARDPFGQIMSWDHVSDGPEEWIKEFSIVWLPLIQKNPLGDYSRIKDTLSKYAEEANGEYVNLFNHIQSIITALYIWKKQKGKTKPTVWKERRKYYKHQEDFDRIHVARKFVSIDDDDFLDYVDQKDGDHPLCWPSGVEDELVGRAILAIEDGDSVTIDPHKMGYTVYPNGAVAFRSDLVRSFITHKAPYITSVADSGRSAAQGGDRAPEDGTTALRQRPTGLQPLRYVRDISECSKPRTESFGQYILEGSRPSAAACSLWLSSQTLPFNRTGHGRLVASSLLAAQWLYHRLKNSMDKEEPNKTAIVCLNRPDTNVINFGVKPPVNRSLKLKHYNTFNGILYRSFSILSEHGEHRPSYLQPFFLSQTKLKSPNYNYLTAKDHLVEALGAGDHKAQYEAEDGELFLLRATIMSPYLLAIRKEEKGDLFNEFVATIHAEAHKVCRRLERLEPAKLRYQDGEIDARSKELLDEISCAAGLFNRSIKIDGDKATVRRIVKDLKTQNVPAVRGDATPPNPDAKENEKFVTLSLLEEAGSPKTNLGMVRAATGRPRRGS